MHHQRYWMVGVQFLVHPDTALPFLSFIQLCADGCFPSRPLFIDDYRTLHIHALTAYELSTAHRAPFCITSPMVVVAGKCIAIITTLTTKSPERDTHILFSTMIHDRHPAAIRLHHILSADQAAIIILHVHFLLMRRSDGKLSEVHTMLPPAGARPGRNRRSHRR